MATKRTTQAPVQAQLIINAPGPVTVTAPDTAALVKTYTEEILPMSAFVIQGNADYVQANMLWTQAKDYCIRVESLFKEARSAAFKAHKAITSLESQLLAPAQQIAGHMQTEILAWQSTQERIRQAEEARVLLAERERVARETRAAQEEADRETARLQAAREAEIEDLAPWEIEDARAAMSAPVIVMPVYVPAPTPIRLASSVPVIQGGPTPAKKPWAARLVSLQELVQAAAKDPTLLEFLQVDQTALNKKARELGEHLGRTIPGVEAYQEQTLKRA